MDAIAARITQGGRLVIPAAIRKAMHFSDGDTVMFQVVGNTLQVRSIDDQIKAVQTFCAPFLGAGVVDEFLAERRQEAARERD